jgi:hypothetical protein
MAGTASESATNSLTLLALVWSAELFPSSADGCSLVVRNRSSCCQSHCLVKAPSVDIVHSEARGSLGDAVRDPSRRRCSQRKAAE